MKQFEGEMTGELEDFVGVVVGMPSADLYHVVYEDGDGEDLTHAELAAIFTGTVDTAMADATGHDGNFDADADDDQTQSGPPPLSCPHPSMGHGTRVVLPGGMSREWSGCVCLGRLNGICQELATHSSRGMASGSMAAGTTHDP